mgnify:CR=1 FL=1
MAISASELRSNVYRLLDEILDTGKALEIERKGQTLRIVAADAGSKLQRLTRHDCIQGDPEELVHMDWSDTWKGELP